MGEVERHRHAGLCWVAITSTIKKLYETKQNKTKKQTPQKIKKKKKSQLNCLHFPTFTIPFYNPQPTAHIPHA